MTVTVPNDAFSSEVPQLLQRHFEALHYGSGIATDVIRERGYTSALKKKGLADRGFGRSQQRPPGLLLPVHTTDGAPPALHAYRPDTPREVRGKELKYEFPGGASMRIDVPPRCLRNMGNPRIPLFITEGQKKADALATHGLCAIALLGVWTFKGKNEFGAVTFLADFDHVAWDGREVHIVFDSDVMVKKPVRAALDRITEHLQRKGAQVNHVYLPPGPNGSKVGVDDYLLHHTPEDLKGLIGKQSQTPQPAEPEKEWLDEAPPTMTKPLCFIDGHAYAATWVYVRTTTTETVNDDGEIVSFAEPRVDTAREMCIVRDDGEVFGAGKNSLDDLGFIFALDSPPADRKLWRKRGVLEFARGTRPDAQNVFERLVSVYHRFLDFSRSLASQREMCELSACFSLATWFHGVFTVLGYPWPNGGYGTGKTKWGTCWAMTSYLGEVVLASTTFPVLRDLAEYGAALCFDDAENLADPKKSDPDKRALLLAGNRVGANIGTKEPDPGNNRKWVTRLYNAYCPRSFTAIRLPDPVLGSRVVPIPLIRTNDSSKGNSDPVKPRTWPCDERELRDDLWALALSFMANAEEIWDELDDEEDVVGREFEPWRAVTAVARLLARHGVDGLEGRMR